MARYKKKEMKFRIEKKNYSSFNVDEFLRGELLRLNQIKTSAWLKYLLTTQLYYF